METSRALSELKDIVLKTVKDILVREAIEKLASRIPFLFAGPLSPLFTYLVKKAISWGMEELSVFIDIKVVGFKTRNQLREMQKIINRVKYAETELTNDERDVLDEAIVVSAFRLIHIK